MRLLIVSDSHGDEEMLSELVSTYQYEIDHFIHCGDSELSPSDTIWSIYTVVKGNCDYGQYEETKVVKCDNKRIYITHGHLQYVNQNRDILAKEAKEAGCDLALYGHTHVPRIETIDGVICFNPGSISFPRVKPFIPSYAILDCHGKHINAHFYNRQHEDVTEQILSK